MNLEQLANFVSAKLDIDIRDNTRKQEYIIARCIYYTLARDFQMGSLSAIGRVLGKNHATVIHSLRYMSKDLERYFPTHYKKYREIRRELKTPSMEIRSFESKYYELEDRHSELLQENALLKSRVESMISKVDENGSEDLVNLVRGVPENKISTLRLRLNAIVKML